MTTTATLQPTCPQWCELTHPLGFESGDHDGHDLTEHGKTIGRIGDVAGVDLCMRESVINGVHTFGPVEVLVWVEDDGPKAFTPEQLREFAGLLLRARQVLAEVTA